MDSRGVSSTAQEHKSEKEESSHTSKQTADCISISIDLADLTCPITQELFFDPVLAMPCGHGFERRPDKSPLKGKCPICRQDIIMFGEAPGIRRDLDKVLPKYPELYPQVYFNLDHFAEVVNNKKLAKPIGERFIKLLQHVAKHLNTKALEGKQKDKTAIEILAGTRAGRELLRKDEKIRALISKESLQLITDGKTISEWLSVEKEVEEIKEQKAHKKEKKDQVSAGGLFEGNVATSSSSAVREAPRGVVPDTPCQRVVDGNEDGALQMLRANPRLVEVKETVITYSGKTIDNATPYQDAICEGDEVMAEKIKAIYLQYNPDGQAVLDAQFNEIFPDGYAAYLEAQKRSADEFEGRYVNPLVDAITNASVADLQAALDKRNNGSALCRVLAEFKNAFDALSKSEKVFNPYHLERIFDKYVTKFDSLLGTEDNPNRWQKVDLLWCQGNGWEERYMPANYFQAFITGLGNMVENHQPLQRSFRVHNYVSNREINIVPLDSDPRCRLGEDFGLYSYYAPFRAAWAAAGAGPARCRFYKSSVEQKQQTWGTYAASAETSRVRLFNPVR